MWPTPLVDRRPPFHYLLPLMYEGSTLDDRVHGVVSVTNAYSFSSFSASSITAVIVVVISPLLELSPAHIARVNTDAEFCVYGC